MNFDLSPLSSGLTKAQKTCVFVSGWSTEAMRLNLNS